MKKPVELTELELGEIYKIKGKLYKVACLDITAKVYCNEPAFELNLTLVEPESRLVKFRDEPKSNNL